LGLGVGDLCTGEREEEEEEGAGKFAGHGNEVVSYGIWSDYGSVRVHRIVMQEDGVQKAQEGDLGLLGGHSFRFHAGKYEASREVSRLELVHDGRCRKKSVRRGVEKALGLFKTKEECEGKSVKQAICTVYPIYDGSE